MCGLDDNTVTIRPAWCDARSTVSSVAGDVNNTNVDTDNETAQ